MSLIVDNLYFALKPRNCRYKKSLVVTCTSYTKKYASYASVMAPSGQIRSASRSEALGHLLDQSMYDALPEPWAAVDM